MTFIPSQFQGQQGQEQVNEEQMMQEQMMQEQMANQQNNPFCKFSSGLLGQFGKKPNEEGSNLPKFLTPPKWLKGAMSKFAPAAKALMPQSTLGKAAFGLSPLLGMAAKGFGVPGFQYGGKVTGQEASAILKGDAPRVNNAHQNIDSLISHNENKDFFELLKGMIPKAGVAENFHPMIGGSKLLQLGKRVMGAPPQETNAFLRGLKDTAFGEADPIGPQGLPFSQFMAQKKAKKGLDPRIKSIITEHANSLFKK